MKLNVEPQRNSWGFSVNMGVKNNRVGEKYMSFQGYEMEIVEYMGARNITIKFNDERSTIKSNVHFKEVKNGCIKNPYHRATINIGFVGEGQYVAKLNGKMTEEYRKWDGMLRRCYDPTNNRNSTYKDVRVCEEWHNFQNFAKWYNDNKIDGWCLDKDILCPTCKIYSPETCCFVPNEVNVLFSKNSRSLKNLPRGASIKDNQYQAAINKFGSQVYLGLYKTKEEAHEVYVLEKLKYLQEVADKWEGIIEDRVIKAIRNFDINLL